MKNLKTLQLDFENRPEKEFNRQITDSIILALLNIKNLTLCQGFLNSMLLPRLSGINLTYLKLVVTCDSQLQLFVSYLINQTTLDTLDLLVGYSSSFIENSRSKCMKKPLRVIKLRKLYCKKMNRISWLRHILFKGNFRL